MSNNNTESKFIRLSKYLDENGLEIGNTITNGFVYALVGIFFGINRTFLDARVDSKTIAIILLFLGFAINLIFYFKQTEKIKSLNHLNITNEAQAETIQNLENRIQEIQKNYTEIFNEHLAYLFIKLELKDSERISMYKFENDKFYIIGRYSLNPNLKKIRRRFYKSNEGLISKAWQDGEYFLNSTVPDYGQNSTARRKTHTFFNNLAPISKETCNNITMKSKSFYLKAFMNSKGIERTSIIVIESENPHAFTKEKLDLIITEEEQKLSSFIDKMDWNFPNEHNAENTGF